LLRKLSAVWLIVVCAQVVLGIYTIWSQRKVDVTTAHVALGALTFMIGWLLVLVSSRFVAARRALAPVAAMMPGELKHA
jgi:heme A synthase